MSNAPPNPYNNAPGAHPNAYPAQMMKNHVQPTMNQPNFAGLKQDSNSNSPLPEPTGIHGNTYPGPPQIMNNFNQSANSSPAFNRPGMLPPSSAIPPSMLPPIKPTPMSANPGPFPNSMTPTKVPFSTSSPRPVNTNNQTPHPPSFIPQQSQQINDNAPPLIPSSQAYNPLTNGPSVSGPPLLPPSSVAPQSQYPPLSRAFSPSSMPTNSAANIGPPINQPLNPLGPIPQSQKPGLPPTSQPVLRPNLGMPLSGIPRNSPTVQGPAMPGPPTSSSLPGPARTLGVNGSMNAGTPPLGPQPIQPNPAMGPPKGQQQMLAPSLGPGKPMGQPGMMMPPINGPPSGPTSLPPMGPPHPAPYQPQQNQLGPGQMMPPMPPAGHLRPHNHQPGLQSGPQSGMQQPPMGPQSLPPQNLPGRPPMPPQNMLPNQQGYQTGPTQNIPQGSQITGPPKSNMQNRYPPMAQGNYSNQMPQQPLPFPQQLHANALAQQMGQMSVTKQGFDQLWGHKNVDLLQCRHVLPEYPEDPPEIRLGQQFVDSPNCSPDIFRCTLNRMPESNSLLQKSRLPLGILIHPFKDLNHLPVIQCTAIVRCRACRTYINPFVYFVDSKRWKCNLCFRVNDLPEEFQYDPVSKSYGDPSRRPEIKSATIEFIAPGEYMLRPPQPAVYLFLMDVSHIARESSYLDIVCKTLKNCIDQLPGDARTQVGFMCYDQHVHFYLLGEGLTRPKEMTVIDVDDVFLPSPESLLVNLQESRPLVCELLSALPARFAPQPSAQACALGAALQAAYKLMAPTGGRITVFQSCLPNVGPGALQPREDPNSRSSCEVRHLQPSTDHYKRLALDCSGAQVAVDLFLLNAQYADLATLSGMSKFSAGTIYHIPLFNANRTWQAEQLSRTLNRYLTRKIGFEAVMRVRATRGLTIHTFHGNFFVRSTDLLSLPNVSPDAGFGLQLAIEESLADLQTVCLQAALLYTSSKGERRIRVHTLALPVCSTLPEVLHSADQMCIIGLLAKMAVDRCTSSSLSEAREALSNVAVDALSAHRLANNAPAGPSAGLIAPNNLRLLPLYLHALMKTKAFRTNTSTRLDDRVFSMCALKSLPLSQLLRAVYPDLYALTALQHEQDAPRMHLTAERVNSTGAYLLDDGDTMIIYVGHAVSPAYLSETFGVTSFSQLPDEARTLPKIDSEGNILLHSFIERLNDERPYPSNILMLRDNSPNRTLFTDRLVDDRVESAFSYYEFLQHVKGQIK